MCFPVRDDDEWFREEREFRDAEFEDSLQLLTSLYSIERDDVEELRKAYREAVTEERQAVRDVRKTMQDDIDRMKKRTEENRIGRGVMLVIGAIVVAVLFWNATRDTAAPAPSPTHTVRFESAVSSSRVAGRPYSDHAGTWSDTRSAATQ